MINFIKRQPPVRIIAFGFLFTILVGSLLLMMPISLQDGVNLNYIDALYTSTSAVCVTGLITVDTGLTFTAFGHTILAILIQIGGLGVATIGAGIIFAIGKKMNLKGANIIKEASNLDSGKGLRNFIKNIFMMTLIIELIGAILSFVVFIQKMDFSQALGVSLFHSIASFNNAGFDILSSTNNFGAFQSLAMYENNAFLLLITSGLIILGGIGFLVIKDIIIKKFKWKKFSMHTKVVLSMSLFLLISGTLLIKLTEDVNWINAFFNSVSARTAGFSTISLSSFSSATLLVIVIFMFIGASPGSTGGGVKTTTIFSLLQGVKSAATNKSEKAFKYSMPKNAFKKASVIVFIALSVILIGTYLILVFEKNTLIPQGVKNSGTTVTTMDALFEMTSAFGTVGLSTGITPYLSIGSKIVSMVIMFIGRLGPLTIASLWFFSRRETFRYPEGNIAIG